MRHRWGLVGMFAAAALVLAGCETVRGGGALPSADPSSSKAASFSFAVKCDANTRYLSGNATYTDLALGVLIRAKVGAGNVSCNNGLPLDLFTGSYQTAKSASTFASHPSGSLKVLFHDT